MPTGSGWPWIDKSRVPDLSEPRSAYTQSTSPPHLPYRASNAPMKAIFRLLSTSPASTSIDGPPAPLGNSVVPLRAGTQP